MNVSLIVGEHFAIARNVGRRHPQRGNSRKIAATADTGQGVAAGELQSLRREVADICLTGRRAQRWRPNPMGHPGY